MKPLNCLSLIMMATLLIAALSVRADEASYPPDMPAPVFQRF